ncbi:MAG: DUF2306 domain-containing protein [Phenylobacterium sp.]
MQTITVVGSSIVLLLATAGLLNLLLAHRPIPASLRSAAVVAHLASVMLALPIGISQLVLPKGTIRHRTVGYIWLGLMVFTALVSFTIHTINPGGLSPIHLFSVLTLVLAPVIAWRARRGAVEKHREAVLGLMLGGLAIAGLFTFLPGRALGQLVLGLFRG